MEPIQGTNNSLNMALISIKALENSRSLDMARAKLALDTVKDSGAQVVELLESLGRNIDLYA